MNDICLEECAPAKDYSHFELKKINLEDMPAFPLEDFTNGMSPRVRGIVLAVYITKIVDALQGRVEYGRVIDRPRGVRIPDLIKVNGLLDDSAEGDPAREALRAAYRNKANGPGKVDREEEGS
jgi:hypothetical protein